MLAGMVDKQNKELQAASPDHCYGEPGDVECDSCTGRKRKAVKSCLVCQVSYCEDHLQPHYQSPAFKKHKLVEVCAELQEKICSEHDKLMDIYCRTDQSFICYLCTMQKHKDHDTVTAEAERTEKQHLLKEEQMKSQQRIQEKQIKLQELKQSVDIIKRRTQTVVEDSERIFTEMISFMEKTRSDVKKLIRVQEKTELSRAERLLNQLEQEIADLQRRVTELDQLLHTHDHIHFLQSFSSLCVSPGCDDSPSFTVHQHLSFDGVNKSLSDLKKRVEEICGEKLTTIRPQAAASHMILPSKPNIGNLQHEKKHVAEVLPQTVLQAAAAQMMIPSEPITNRSNLLEERLSFLPHNKKKQAATNRHKKHQPQAAAFLTFPPSEPKSREDFLQYFCSPTLDPITAHPELTLSEMNKAVTRSNTEHRYSDHPERFNYCTQVLCKESVCGRCYWEVEWSDGVFISVSYKEISRKGRGVECVFGYNSQSWSLECFYSSVYFRHDKIQNKIQVPASSRIGVYVDHSAGTLSFYNVSDTMTLLHSVRTTFTQPLFAGFKICSYNSRVKLLQSKQNINVKDDRR